MTTATTKIHKAALAEINGRIARLEQKAPNFMRFRHALDRAYKTAARTGNNQHQCDVAKLTEEALAAYKAKEYDKAQRLCDEAGREAARGPGAAEGEVVAAARSPRPPAATSATKAKKARAPKAAKEPKPARQSALNLAAAYLARCENPKNIREITEAVLAAGWKTTGKTPGATLNAAIIREIRAKGKESRFAKGERGMFTKGDA